MRHSGTALFLSVLLAACDNGTLTLSVADAPIDQATNVQIRFTGVEVVESDGTEHDFTLDPPIDAQLMDANGEGARVVLLDKETLPAGDYKSITLRVSAGTGGADSFITLVSTAADSGKHPLTLVDSDAGLLKASKAFQIERQKNIALTADFDLRRSIRKPANAGDPYRFKPSLRIVKDADVGSVVGTVAASFLTDAGCGASDPVAVYLYSGSNVTPDDVDGTVGNEPVATAVVRGSSYHASILDPDTYTAFISCQALDDDAGADDDVEFLDGSREFTVTEGTAQTVNFPGE